MSFILMLLLVAVGGAFGACSRFLVSYVMVSHLGLIHAVTEKSYWSVLPVLTVNVLGSFIMGMVAVYVLNLGDSNKLGFAGIDGESFKLLIMVGFLGSFTTVSSFSLETVIMLQSQLYFKAILNILLTLILSVGACGLGMLLVRKL